MIISLAYQKATPVMLFWVILLNDDEERKRRAKSFILFISHERHRISLIMCATCVGKVKREAVKPHLSRLGMKHQSSLKH